MKNKLGKKFAVANRDHGIGIRTKMRDLETTRTDSDRKEKIIMPLATA